MWIFLLFSSYKLSMGCDFLTTLKGQTNEIFYLQFFSSFESTWVTTDQWVKIFWFWLRLRRGLGSKKWFSDPEEIDSPGYVTPKSDFELKFESLLDFLTTN